MYNSLWPSQNKMMFGFDNPETDCWHPHYYLMSGGQLTKLMCQLSRPQYIKYKNVIKIFVAVYTAIASRYIDRYHLYLKYR